MSRAALVGLAIVVCLSGPALAADCGCGTSQAVAPDCYVSFWSGEVVSFKLVVPMEYLFGCVVCDAPMLTGWRVETQEGGIIYQDASGILPMGHWYEITWNQQDSSGSRVPGGFYRVVIETDHDEYAAFVKIVERPCYVCACYCPPCLCSRPCGVCFGVPYVLIERVARAGIPLLSVTLPTGGCGCP